MHYILLKASGYFRSGQMRVTYSQYAGKLTHTNFLLIPIFSTATLKIGDQNGYRSLFVKRNLLDTFLTLR